MPDSTKHLRLNWSSKMQENNDRKNTTLLHRIVCFQMHEKGFMPETFLRFNFWGENFTSFSKTTSLQRESFLKMFYSINSSPVLFTKYVFMVIKLWSNYQRYTLPLMRVIGLTHHSKTIRDDIEIIRRLKGFNFSIYLH